MVNRNEVAMLMGLAPDVRPDEVARYILPKVDAIEMADLDKELKMFIENFFDTEAEATDHVYGVFAEAFSNCLKSGANVFYVLGQTPTLREYSVEALIEHFPFDMDRVKKRLCRVIDPIHKLNWVRERLALTELYMETTSCDAEFIRRTKEQIEEDINEYFN